jgi:NAD(P)-dependent dehydrogenase (short-subunit alcohol dehydrogenase family)
MKKTAIITGASGNGIGRSVTLTLARDGFQVVVNYRTNRKSAEALCAVINNNGGNAIAIQADVFSHQDCERLINETIAHFGRVDVCIIGPGADWNPEPIENLDVTKSLKDVVQEVQPIYSLIPKLIPEMEKTNSGRIIAIASNPKLPSPSYSYNTAKNTRITALSGMVDTCWRHKITLNVIAPGPIEHLATLSDAIEQTKDFPVNTSSISPQDVAEMISYICSERGRYLTGGVIEYQF